MKVARAEKVLDPRRTPSQRRSAATVVFILDAAEDIIEAKGLAGLNTNAIAQKAGVSVGSIYQYFANKEAIVQALVFRMHEAILSSLSDLPEKLPPESPDNQLRRIVSSSIELHRARPKLTQILEQEEDRLPRSPELENIEKDIGSALGRVMATQLNVDHLEPGSLDLIAADALNIIRVMTVPAENRPDERIDDRIYWALKGYLEKWGADNVPCPSRPN